MYMTPNEQQHNPIIALQGDRKTSVEVELCSDRATFLAALICAMPMSLVVLGNGQGQWVTNCIGLAANTVRSIIDFCGKAANGKDPVFLDDVATCGFQATETLILRYADVRACAIAPLLTSTGEVLGVFAVFDSVPHELRSIQQAAFAALSREVAIQLELRLDVAQLRDTLAGHTKADQEYPVA